MIWLFIILIAGVFIISYLDMLNKFDVNSKKLKETKVYFEKIENGMSLNEVNSLLGNKGKLVSNKNDIVKYKWLFEEIIVGKSYIKDNEPTYFVSLLDYLKKSNQYYLIKDNAFVEVEFKNNEVCNKKAIGLI